VASNTFIINASPLIFLYKISGLEWVCRLADSQMVVPQAVIQDIAAGDGDTINIQTVGFSSRVLCFF